MKEESDEFDLVILGGGAAAFAAAIRADELGFRSAIVNAGLPMGGTCVNVGCIPSKFLLEAGNEHFYRQSPQFACNVSGSPRCDFPEAISNKDRMVLRLRRSNYSEVLKARKIEYIEARGKLLPGRKVRAGDRLLRARRILIATGSSPRIPPIEGLEKAGYLTNRTLMQRKELPKELQVLGGGPLGLEFAQMYAHFGTHVTVLESAPRILPLEEPEVSVELADCLRSEGLVIHTGARVRRISRRGGGVECELANRRGVTRCRADEILVATGVAPNTLGMGLEPSGIALTERGYVKTDATLKTSATGIWAAGDVAGHAALETEAAKEGALAATNALQGKKQTIDYHLVPHAVFTNPQVASVGFTEAEFLRQGGSASAGRSGWSVSRRP